MFSKKHEPEKEDKKPKGPFRILVVEDEPDVRNVLALFINKYGYELCGAAESAEDAITLIETTSPDVILIDYMLKGPMTGVDLAIYINKHFQIPFIYITGYSDNQIIERVIHTRPAAFILKPFKGEEIKVAVEILINQVSARK